MSLLKRFISSKTFTGNMQGNIAGLKRSFSTYVDNAPEKYPVGIRVLHWAIAGGFFGAFYSINVALRTQGEEKARLMRLHESFGATTALLVLPRLYLRYSCTAMPKHVPGNILETVGATLGHWGLYACMFFLPFSGLAMGVLGGKGFHFWGVDIKGKSNPTPGDGKTTRALFLLHRDIGQLSEVLTLIHIASVPYHWVRGHGNILTRII